MKRQEVLAKAPSSKPSLVKAKLVKDVPYEKDDEQLFIPEGTEIVVDVKKSVGLYGKDHVTLFKDEYAVIH